MGSLLLAPPGKPVVYAHKGILLGHRKNETMTFAATGLDVEIVILSEMSQTEKDKYHTMSFLWVCYFINMRFHFS